MPGPNQQDLVVDQFSPNAVKYLESPAHAGGADLDQIAATVRDRRPGRVLDLGCGGGHVSYAVAPHAETVIAYDIAAGMLAVVADQAGKRGLGNLEVRQGAAERIPFPDASFDMVISRLSAHHWGDFAQGLTEAARVLRPDGLAIFVDIVAPSSALLDTVLQTIEILRDPSHVRDYSEAEWCHALTQAGLIPEPAGHWRRRHDFAAWIDRMTPPDCHVAAIRSLCGRMADPVTRHFAIEADGSFTVDMAMILARPGGTTDRSEP